MPLPALIRTAAISCAITLAAMSWLPSAALVRTGISQPTVHVLAYLGIGVLAKAAWPRIGTLKVLGALTIMAAILEIGQIWAPGRAARMSDVALGVFGAVLAAFLAWLYDAVRNPVPPAVARRPEAGEPLSPAVARPVALSHTWLLAILWMGGVLTLVWIAGLLWALYLFARWLFA